MKKMIFILLLTGIFSCPILSQSKVSNEEYKIYAIVLKQIRRVNLIILKQKTLFVILNETVKPAFFDDSDNRKMKGLSKNFRKKNQSTVKLNRQFPVKYKYNLVSKNELNTLFEIGSDNIKKVREKQKNVNSLTPSLSDVYWKPFHKKFSVAEGYYSFSRIGFSSTKRFAVLEVFGKGAYWSSNSTFILIKTKRGWKIYISAGSRDIV